jgi:predicted dehydrogenase
MAQARGVVNQVGYHYRFVGAFEEVKRLLDCNAIGTVSHVLAEASGPVVLRAKGMSWRTQKAEGGGCLYDYAAHPVNLLNWLFGPAQRVDGAVLSSIFSADTDDEVYGTIHYASGPNVQLSVNWSDESFRKMSVRLTVWGSGGRIYADRQECQAYLRNTDKAPAGYVPGWNVRYTTDLTRPVWFYLRGEEYSAQLDYFIRCIVSRQQENINSFADAAETDRVLGMIRDSALSGPTSTAPTPQRRGGLFGLRRSAQA